MEKKLEVVKHPLIEHKLAILRDKNTPHFVFRAVINEVASLLCYETCRDLSLIDTEVETPMEAMKIGKLPKKKLILASILRAGNGLLEGMLSMVPTAAVAHIGVFRDPKTLEANEYYFKAPPNLPEAEVILVDPMLATGGSAIAAVERLKAHGATKIRFVCLLAAPEGVKALHDAHPEIVIWTAALDRELNEKAYILPGLGDAGDRIFGTA